MGSKPALDATTSLELSAGDMDRRCLFEVSGWRREPDAPLLLFVEPAFCLISSAQAFKTGYSGVLSNYAACGPIFTLPPTYLTPERHNHMSPHGPFIYGGLNPCGNYTQANRVDAKNKDHVYTISIVMVSIYILNLNTRYLRMKRFFGSCNASSPSLNATAALG